MIGLAKGPGVDRRGTFGINELDILLKWHQVPAGEVPNKPQKVAKWQEILEIEAQLRKQKREHEHRKIEVRQKIIEWSAGIAIFIICTGCMVGFVWLMTL